MLDWIRNYILVWLLFGVSIWSLRPHTDIMVYACVGSGINELLNIALKVLTQQPRPTSDAHAQWKRLHWEARPFLPISHYGMPSGHAQYAAFLTTFVYYMSHPRHTVLATCLALSIAIGLQRIIDRHHSTLQVLAGYLVGIGTGHMAVSWATQHHQGKIQPRADDGHLGDPTLSAL